MGYAEVGIGSRLLEAYVFRKALVNKLKGALQHAFNQGHVPVIL